ncbi:MAG TPA: glutamate-5-semialdehyde dehydrogenase [Limnochordia bacterium]
MVLETEVVRRARAAKSAARSLAALDTRVKDRALRAMADAIEADEETILAHNARDVEQCSSRGALLDRLRLNPDRIRSMAEGLRAIASLPDPVGTTVAAWRRPNGLEIAQVRVPLGVVGIIYEARPNVTADATGLCLKAGNAVLLRGSAEAIESNKAIAQAMARAAYEAGIPEGAIQLVEATDRSAALEMMRLNGLIDLLIPRGGAGLIRSVVEHATIPVIETGVGNCHVYIDASADAEMAEAIVLNAKTQRPSVCNAIETLLVHEAAVDRVLPRLLARLTEAGVQLRGCPKTRRVWPEARPATEDDWGTEFLDLILAVRVVGSLDEALEHIATYGSGHSEAIVTQDYASARRFLREVDAAAVYVNASTRFTDGYEFGFGAEIGISTQKLHARGPMGLAELTSTKYIILGDGQIRA